MLTSLLRAAPRRAPLVLLALLAACGRLPGTAPSSFPATVHGVHVEFRLVAPGALPNSAAGMSWPVPGGCVVELDAGQFATNPDWANLTVPHEVGHCLDRALLGGSHGGFAGEGAVFGPYYAAPGEGFAQAYAALYRQRCGLSLRPLGWVDSRAPVCDAPPRPEDVRPALVPVLAPLVPYLP